MPLPGALRGPSADAAALGRRYVRSWNPAPLGSASCQAPGTEDSTMARGPSNWKSDGVNASGHSVT